MAAADISGVMCPCGHEVELHRQGAHLGCDVTSCRCTAGQVAVLNGKVTREMMLGLGFSDSSQEAHCVALREKFSHVQENRREQSWFHILLAHEEIPVAYAPVAKVAFLGLAPWFGLAVVTEDRLFAFKINDALDGEVFSWPWSALENIYWVPELTGQATAKIEPYGCSRVQLRVVFRRHTYAFDVARSLWIENCNREPRAEHYLMKGEIKDGMVKGIQYWQTM